MNFMHRAGRRHHSLLVALALAGTVAACAHNTARENTASGAGDSTTRALRSKVDTIVVIYAENRAFDNLYGNFPGARGLNEVVDGDGRPLPPIRPRSIATAPCLPPCRRPGAA
jgi:phospholipase C